VRVEWAPVTDNRRTTTRHTVAIPAKVVIDGNERDSTVVNLSLGGAQLESSARHAMGQRMQIKFTVPASSHLIDIGATVRWSDSRHVGLQFDGLRARDVWALNEYFKLLE
jgi:hypothetical protein